LEARSAGIRTYEVIRHTLEKEIDQDPVANARAFFESFQPLESFEDVNSAGYVRKIRSKGRILRSEMRAPEQS